MQATEHAWQELRHGGFEADGLDVLS